MFSNSSKNRTKNEVSIMVVMSNFFVRFLEELRVPKSTFEINGILHHHWFYIAWIKWKFDPEIDDHLLLLYALLPRPYKDFSFFWKTLSGPKLAFGFGSKKKAGLCLSSLWEGNSNLYLATNIRPLESLLQGLTTYYFDCSWLRFDLDPFIAMRNFEL